MHIAEFGNLSPYFIQNNTFVQVYNCDPCLKHTDLIRNESLLLY